MWTYQHAGFRVHQIPALKDNYIYLIEAGNGDTLAAVDPAEAVPVEATCRGLGRPLTHILNTHHHWDHTGANLELKSAFGCSIAGAAHDAARIPGIDLQVDEANPPRLAGLDIRVLHVDGHTLGHIAYLIGDALFCGDTLFGAGCGRLFEGSPQQMWQSLNLIAQLPDNTKVYCAHEYTLHNLGFARQLAPENPDVVRRMAQDEERRRRGEPTIPSTLALEKTTNPFLWPLDTGFCRDYASRHATDSEPAQVFADIRSQRDHY